MSIQDHRRDYISVSQIQMYQRCPAQFYFRYVLGRSSPPGWALVGGRAMDETLNVHHQNRIEGRATDVYLPDLFRTELEKAANAAMPVGEVDYDYENLGPYAVQAYLRDADPHIEPISVQTELRGEIEGVPVLGFRDILYGDRITGDHKFTKKTPKAMPASSSFQLHTYDLMEMESGKDHSGHVALILIRKLKTPKVEFSHYQTKPSDHNVVRHTVKTVRALTEGNHFPMCDLSAQNGTWPCSERFCGYFRACRGSEEGVPHV